MSPLVQVGSAGADKIDCALGARIESTRSEPGDPGCVMGLDAVDRSDEALLADHLAGRPGAFDELAGRYVHELFGFLYKFVNNAAVAEDLVQDALLQVHMAAASFDPTRAFKPWLYTVAANKARDHLRFRGRRQEQSLDATGQDGEGTSPSQSVEAPAAPAGEQVEDEERRQQVRALIARMPEHLRMILVLGYYQQLPYAEIAEILGIPVGTVKSRLHSAVTHFGNLWHEHVKSQATERRAPSSATSER